MQKAKSEFQGASSLKNPLPSTNDNDAVKLVNLLLLAWRNYSLYPEGHANSIRAIANLESAFHNFFSFHNELQLSVGKNRLMHDGKVVHEVSSTPGAEDMVSLLYRDGIQSLEFYQGLLQDELVYFFSTLKEYRVLAEEAEGDIVTSLNEGNLEHINFKAVDIFWEDLPPLDFETINDHIPEAKEPVRHVETDDTAEPEDSGRMQTRAKSIADPSRSKTLWEISPTEQEKLQKMVEEEENWDNTEDVFDVLLVILRSQTDQDSFSSVLDFTLEEVIETAEQGEFNLLLNLFKSLQHLSYRDASPDNTWLRPLIERFFQDLSHPDIFDRIIVKLKILNGDDEAAINTLRELLLYFSPSVIIPLGDALLQTRSSAVENMIFGILEYQSLKDMEPMEILLDHPDQKLGEKLLPLLTKLQGERSSNVFSKMSEHPSKIVQKEAVRVMLERDPQSILKLFHLIDDPSREIRRLILEAVAKQKSSVLENSLLKHINENINNKDIDHLLACYYALGRCGSSKIIPHLRRILLDKGWNRFMGLGKPAHREGAATALAMLGNQQAEHILLKASQSRFQVIRDAYQKAMTRRDKSGEGTNG